MKGLSDHTLLMNQMIGLCKKTYGWPSTLKELGYFVELIEPIFVNSESKKVNADLRLTSNKLVHTLVTECKGGVTVDDQQIEKYAKLTVESIIRKTMVHDPRRLEFEVVFATNIKFRDELLKRIGTFPLIIFSETELTKENKFQNKELENAFSSPIAISTKPPTHFYPFNDQDDRALIALYVFQKLVVLSLGTREDSNEIDIDTILSKIQPFWKDIDETKKKALRGKVNDILFEYQKREELKEYLEKVKGKSSWRITKSLDAFRKGCQKIIDNLEKQRKLDVW